MTKDEAVALVKQTLAYRTDLASAAPLGLAQAQDYMQDEWPRPDIYPWFLKTEDSSSTTSIDEERVALPADWLSDWEEGGLFLYDSEGGEHELIKNDYDALKAYYRGYDATLPAAYATDGLYYRLFPTPDKAYSLKQIYYQKDASIVSLDGSATNKWLTHAPWAIIGRAAFILGGSGINKNVQLAANSMTDAVNAIINRSIWLQMTNRRMAMGETL